MMKKALGLLILALALTGCASTSDRDRDLSPSQPQFKGQATWMEPEPAWRSDPSLRPMPYPPYYRHPKE